MINYKFKTKPYAHQLKALEKSWDKEVYAYFMEMGTGKSKVLIDNLAMLYEKGKVNGALIVAPKGVVGTWYNNELPTHLPDHIDNKTVLWQAMINKTQEKKLDTLFETGEELHILIMNVEAFSTKKGVDFARKFLSCHNTLMAIDESTTIKNPGAKRTKNILGLSKYSKYRRILTGSPVTKSPLDLYTQCQFLDPWLLGHASYYGFRTRYAIMKNANFNGRSVQIVVGYHNLGELSEKLHPFSYRVLKDDCLDLPEKTFIKRTVQLSPDQHKLYNQMKEKALAVLNDKMVSTTTVMTQLMRLQQITCGHFTADDGSTQEIPNNRIDELTDVLEEIEGKVVIWGQWQKDINQIIKAIVKEYGEKSVVDYYGLTPKNERQKNIDKFQTDPDCRFFVGTPATGGYGITLTAASNMIYYSNGYNLEFRTQSEARIDRIGQKYPMTYIDIICENTVDERIVKALRNKINIASKVMGEELKDWI
ncbi:DEAD/DEAH box helicase [Marine Group I thaumarchaeote]|uniref:DEAD/DEAH box helicase n=1 Tax=Marine Group I thaumarchaeote TaxID=2511932 RepID=A0A7K4MWG4_9ARCH|nr:DEAD/DEAH box helicase [Marine Group I thaumarchaeote]